MKRLSNKQLKSIDFSLVIAQVLLLIVKGLYPELLEWKVVLFPFYGSFIVASTAWIILKLRKCSEKE